MSASPPAAGQRHEPTAAEFRAMQQNPKFVELKKTFRSFTFPMSVAFFVWYLFYVFLATYTPGFMSKSVLGSINMGIVMGIAQFVTTFLITWVYIKFANKQIEPRAAAIRQEMEG